MGEAGGSARAEHERRRAREREQHRASLGPGLVLIAACAGVAAVAVVALQPRVLPWLTPTATYGFAALCAIGITASLGQQLWGRRQTTEAWAAGARGEEMTAAVLGPLEQQGIVVLHDRRIPRSRANIDHLVVAPSGVSVVDSKHYARGATISRDGVRSGGRRIDKALEGARRQQRLVSEALGGDVPVRVVLCIHGGPVQDTTWRGRPVVDGVRICGPRRLAAVVTAGGSVLPPASVRATAEALAAAFPPAVRPAGDASG